MYIIGKPKAQYVKKIQGESEGARLYRQVIDTHAHVDEVEAFGWHVPPEKLIRLIDEIDITISIITTYVDEPGPEDGVERLQKISRRIQTGLLASPG